jgi:cytochrome P450
MGNSLAMMEAQLVLATVAQRYSFHGVSDYPRRP